MQGTVDRAFHLFLLRQSIRFGDFGNQQGGQGGEKGGGKEQQRHGHPLEHAELGKRILFRVIILCQAVGNQDILDGAQNGIEISPCRDGYGDPQQLAKHAVIPWSGQCGIGELPLIQQIAAAKIYAGSGFRQGVPQQNGQTGVGNAHGRKTIDNEHYDADTHQLFENLGTGGRGGLPPGDKIAAQAGGYSHKG